jgi:hypothetical protein
MLFPEFYTNMFLSLAKYQVRYLLVGGHAVNYHGVVRNTLDLDLWIEKDDDNLSRLLSCLIDLNFSQSKCHAAIDYFSNHHKFDIIRDGYLIEIMDSYIFQFNFEQAYSNRIEEKSDNLTINIISLDHLLILKSKSLRQKDLLDAEELKKFHNLSEDDNTPFTLD